MKGFLCVLGSFILHLSLGTSFLWGNISLYVASYMQIYDPTISLDGINVVFIIQIVVSAVSLPLGSILSKAIPLKILILIGGTISIGSVFVVSYVKDLKTFAMIYSICQGLGVGICYMPPIMASWEHFPNHKGVISGIIMTGYGLSAFIFGLISVGKYDVCS